MNIIEIINKKADKAELSKSEIAFMIEGAVNDKVRDYQLSAFLMAVKINGFTEKELFAYTDVLINSGKVLPLNLDRVDKHSTGGIGDKVSLILFPIFEKMGIKIFKFSGRSLGYTGGTLDKLATVKHFKLHYSMEEIINSKHNLLLEASGEFNPADKVTYAIRDTAGSIDSLDLIAASIMAKKISSGAKYIFIDLKCGSGAFISNQKTAQELAIRFEKIAKFYDREIFILISNMDEPLGNTAGNAIEVQEAMNFFEGVRENKLAALIEKIVVEVFAKMKKTDLKEARKVYHQILESGDLKDAFIDWIKEQKGDVSEFLSGTFFKIKTESNFYAPAEGYFRYKDLKEIGFFLIDIKAGRNKKDDLIDPYAGIRFYKKTGDYVNKNDLLFTIYSDEKLSESQNKAINDFFEIKTEKISPKKIILDEIRW